jgi:hypothetical protein
VLEALQAGRIDPARARVLADGTSHLPEETARAVIEAVIGRAGQLTTGQLRDLLRKTAVTADPDSAAHRYEEATADRRVSTEMTVDGTVNLYGINLAPDRVAAVMNRIDNLAQSLRGKGEMRTINQLRADILLDLLEGTNHQKTRRGTVDIHVDLTTLMHLSENPGDLAGYGPVIADLARQITDQQPGAEWRYTITDPDSGQVIGNGTTRRRPTASQTRHVQARNQTCIFPGCRMPALDCDLDHRIPWAQGGPTTTRHLVPLCRHDHTTRHKHGWTHQPLPNGDHLWTSPLGHTYTTSGQPP